MFLSSGGERLALLFAGAGAERLAALARVDAELTRATRASLEHDIAHTRLAWWRAEIERLVSGTPEHPATRVLATAPFRPDWTLLRERLAAAELALGGFRPATLAEAEALAYRSHGSLWQVGVTLLAGRSSAPLLAYGAALGKGSGLAGAALSARDAGPVTRTEYVDRARVLLASSAAAPAGEADGRLAAAYVANALARAATAARPPAGFVQVFSAWRAARRAHRTDDHAE